MKRGFAVAAVCLVFASPTASTAQGISSDFPELWGDFMGLCGAILSDPAKAFETPPIATGYPQYGWAKNEDSTDISGHFSKEASATLESLASFHLLRKPAGFDLFCDAHVFGSGRYEPTSAGAAIRSMIEAGGAMQVSGGLYADVPGGTLPYPTTSTTGPTYSLIVAGAFPETDVVVQVNLEADGLALTLYANLPKK